MRKKRSDESPFNPRMLKEVRKDSGSPIPVVTHQPAVADALIFLRSVVDDITCLRPSGPFRPPDYRSRLAALIATEPDQRLAARLCTWADERTNALVKLQGSLRTEHPLAKARELRNGKQPFLLAEVESRLLAGQSSTDIAAVTGLDAETVEYFHDAFYCVRDRLANGGYIRHSVLGTPPEGDPDNPPLELLRFYGYFSGPFVLEQVLTVYKEIRDGTSLPPPTSAREWFDLAVRLSVRASIASYLLPIPVLHKYPRQMRLIEKSLAARRPA